MTVINGFQDRARCRATHAPGSSKAYRAGATMVCAAGMLIMSWVLPVSAEIVIEFDAATAGAGVDPAQSSPAWTRFGTAMTNTGVFLLQDNTGNDPSTQFGEYLSPSAGAGFMTLTSGTYGIEFRVRPLTDVPNLGGSHYANLYVYWEDDTYGYNMTIDLDTDDGGPGTTGGLRYGRNSMLNAVTGLDWSLPHTLFIGYTGAAPSGGNFDVYVDGSLQASIPAAGAGGSKVNFAQNRVDFGDGTTGQGIDVAAEWYFIRIHDTAGPGGAGQLFADADGDADVDLDDYGRMQSCLTIPGQTATASCRRFDRPETNHPYGDGDIDPVDVNKFLACMNGPNVAVQDPDCFGTVIDISRNHLALYFPLLDSEAAYDALIEQSLTHGVDTLIPSISAGASVGFVTPKENYLPDLADELAGGFDSLAVLIEKAHEVDMKVYPSVAIAPVNLLIFGHPEWETKDRNGQPSSATTGTSLAFSYPLARQAKVAMMMDLVNGYDIDGVWLDYCRYPENSANPAYICGFYGYDNPLIQQSLTQWGFDPRNEPVGSPNWDLFNGLRMNSVTSFVQELRAAITLSGRDVKLAGFGDTELANDHCAARDWPTWAQGGHIDEFYAGNYVVPVAGMRQVMIDTRALIGPSVVLHGALTPFNNFLSTNQEMVDATKQLLLGGADRLWIYREDWLTMNGMWEGAAQANKKYIRMTQLTGTPVISYDAPAAGAGIEPNEVVPPWNLLGTASMTNTGGFLLQDNTTNPASESGFYETPAFPGLMSNSAGYAILFRVRPLVDISATEGESTYANLYVSWADDSFVYHVTPDLDGDDGGAGVTGEVRVGGNAMISAASGIDWSTPHTVRVQYDAVDAEFYFHVDDLLVNCLPASAVQVGSSTAPEVDRLLFGDGTSGGTDAAAEWYSVELQSLDP